MSLKVTITIEADSLDEFQEKFLKSLLSEVPAVEQATSQIVAQTSDFNKADEPEVEALQASEPEVEATEDKYARPKGANVLKWERNVRMLKEGYTAKQAAEAANVTVASMYLWATKHGFRWAKAKTGRKSKTKQTSGKVVASDGTIDMRRLGKRRVQAKAPEPEPEAPEEPEPTIDVMVVRAAILKRAKDMASDFPTIEDIVGEGPEQYLAIAKPLAEDVFGALEKIRPRDFKVMAEIGQNGPTKRLLVMNKGEFPDSEVIFAYLQG